MYIDVSYVYMIDIERMWRLEEVLTYRVWMFPESFITLTVFAGVMNDIE